MAASLETLSKALYLEEVARARIMRPEEKLLEGPRLFDRACRVMADCIRHRHPELDEQAVLTRIKGQLALLDHLSEP